MTLTLRSASTSVATTKGTPLTHAEMDANWLHTPAQLAASSGSSLVGFAQSGIGAVSRELESHVREIVVNARGFGSKFATTPAADINLAITAVNTAGGGTVLIPAGSWTAETTIIPKSNVWLKGAGITATTLTLADGLNKDLIRNPNTSFGVNGPDTNIRISDMELDGNKANQTAADNVEDAHLANIRLKNVERCIVERVYTHSSRGYGVELKAALDCVVSHSYATACDDDGFSVTEFGLGAVSYSRRNKFMGCSSWSNVNAHGGTAGSGFEVDDGPQDTSFINCHSWSNTMGLFVHQHSGSTLAPKGITVIGGSYNSNTADGINCDSLGSAGALTENLIFDGVGCGSNTDKGFDVVNCQKVEIVNCRADSSAYGINIATSIDFIVANNIVRGNTTRQIIISGSGTSSGNVRGNIVRRNGQTPASGVTIGSGVSGIVVENNDLTDSTASANDYISNAGTNTRIRNNIGAETITPVLTASQNDYAPTAAHAPLWRVLSSGLTPWTVTGIAGGVTFLDRTLTFVNADGSDAVVIANQSSSSVAANRITTGTGSDLVVPPQGVVQMTYDSTSSAWRVVGASLGAAVYKLNATTTAVGNVGTGEDNLMTYAMPAQTLSKTGAGVRITAWGTVANNANTKEVKLYFGSGAVITTALTVSQVGKWYIEAVVLRTGADVQDYVSKLNEYGTASQTDMENGALTEDDGAAITIKCAGTVTDGGGGVNNNDIVQEGLLVEYLS